MSKRCVQCGVELEEQALFCDECGAKQPENTKEMKKKTGDGVQNQEKEKQSICGILSFALGLISVLTLGIFFIPEIAGIVLGVIGIQDKTKKRGLALTGLVLSGIGVAIVIVILLAAIFSEF